MLARGYTHAEHGASIVDCELFEQVERQHLLLLPSERLSFCELARATVNIDYHVAFDSHFYSAPYQLRYEAEPVVALRVTSTMIEILFKTGASPRTHAAT